MGLTARKLPHYERMQAGLAEANHRWHQVTFHDSREKARVNRREQALLV